MYRKKRIYGVMTIVFCFVLVFFVPRPLRTYACFLGDGKRGKGRMLYLEKKRCKPMSQRRGDGDCRDLAHSCCLLNQSSSLNYVLCCRCRRFNLSELISPVTTWERDVETLTRLRAY